MTQLSISSKQLIDIGLKFTTQRVIFVDKEINKKKNKKQKKR